MKKIILFIIILCTSFSKLEAKTEGMARLLTIEQQDKLETKIREFFSFGSNNSEIIEKLKNKQLKYEMLSFEENKEKVETSYIVNDKILYYTFYKNKRIYKKELEKALNNNFFNKINEKKLEEDKKYKKIILDPIISSSSYGKWCLIVGENQIIKGGGADFYSAEENANEFFLELKKLIKE